jgi:uncharacterized protein YcbX
MRLAKPIVSALSSTPVKGLRICLRDSVELKESGIRGDRRLYLVDGRLRLVNGKRLGKLMRVVPELDEAERRLRLRFADGRTLDAPIELGEELTTQFYSRPRRARSVLGPFSAALSELVGEELRLVAPADGAAVDRGAKGAVTLISRASLEELATAAGRDAVDARRFRMSVEIDGVEPFAEDAWVGREVRLGGARVRLRGHVGRCLVTSRHPESGEADLPTLEILSEMRETATSTEPIPFGVYGSVTEPGPVAVGDAVEPLG